MRLTSIFATAALAAAPLTSAAHAQALQPSTTQTPITTQEIARSYGDTTGTDRRQVLARLNALCESDRRYDRQRCDAAWRIINRAHADLQAKRARAD